MSEDSVLFVCLGNIIRSPLCEGLFRKYTGGKIEVDSAAVTYDDLGQHPHPLAQRIASEHGFDISGHVSRLISVHDFSSYKYIVSLEPYVYNRLKKMQPPRTPAKIVELIPKTTVINPWCGDYKDFRDMFNQINPAMKSFISMFIQQ